MSDMSMVERVARAIDPSCWEIPEEDYPAERARREAKQFSSLAAAKRAIEAMREPTEVMVKAGASIYCSEYEAPEIWKDMIDAALNE